MDPAAARDVETYSQLNTELANLAKQYGKLVFRGQTQLHDGRLIPSIARKSPASEMEQELWYIFCARVLGKLFSHRQSVALPAPLHSAETEVSVMRILTDNEFSNELKQALRLAVEPLLQHYGARSNFVDASNSLCVALWFAHHQFVGKDVHFHKLSSDNVPLIPTIQTYSASYTPAWTDSAESQGYLFVLRPSRFVLPTSPDNEDLGHGDFIDLTSMGEFERAKRQVAGLMYCDPTIGAIDSRNIVATYRLKLPLSGSPSTCFVGPSVLFPPPSEDQTYDFILALAPFLEKYNSPSVLQRLWSLPEFYPSADRAEASPLWKHYRQRDSIVYPTWALPLVGFEGESSPAQKTTCNRWPRKTEVFPILIDHGITYTPRSLRQGEEIEAARYCKDEWPLNARSVFVEFHPYEWALTPLDWKRSLLSRQTANVQAVQVLQGKRGFACRIFYRDEHGIHLTRGHQFNKPGSKRGFLHFDITRLSDASDGSFGCSHWINLFRSRVKSSAMDSIERDEIEAEKASLSRVLRLLYLIGTGKLKLEDKARPPRSYFHIAGTRYDY